MAVDSVNIDPPGIGGPNNPRIIKPSILTAIPHYLPLGIFPLLLFAAIFGGWWLLPPFIFMSVTGLFDKLFGVDGKNMDPYQTSERSLFWHNLPVWTWAILWPPLLIFSMWQILVAGQLSTWECIALAILLAMEAQAVFIIGHELIHRRVAWERRLAEFLLASASYPTYATEHVYIHHAKVGTPYDVGSAPKGESFWHYLPKELVSNITNSWAIDKDRLARRGLPVWHYTNPFWRYGFELLFWHGLAFLMGGIWAIPVFAFLGFGCVFSMKLSNYLQHYGLRRVLLPSGRWEKVSPRHSWSADWKFSNWMFFNMQRHADHHARASRHYPLLQFRGPEESPSLPGTYADMMNVVIRPKKWFEKMDPLVEQWRDYFYPEIDDWSAYDSPVAMARPDDFPAIVEIFGASPKLARWIESHPKFLDSLKEREFLDLDLPMGINSDPEFESLARKGLARVYWTHEVNVQEMKERIAEWPSADANETARIVQGWTNDKVFQIGMHVVRGNLTPSEAAIAYSNLGEASVAVVLDAVIADFVERTGPLPVAIAAVFQGDLATKEFQLGGNLDLLLIHDSDSAEMNSKVCLRFNEVLTTLVQDSLLFSAEFNVFNGVRTLALKELANHCNIQMGYAVAILTKSRAIYEYGNAELISRLNSERNLILANKLVVNNLLAHLSKPQDGAEEQEVSILYSVKCSLGKLDNAARYLQLTNEEYLVKEGAASIVSILANAGQETLVQEALYWRELQGALALVGSKDFDSHPASVKALVAKICGHEDIQSLEASVLAKTASSNSQVSSIFNDK